MDADDQSEIEAINEEQAKNALPMPLREWINEALAFFVKPHDYSNRDLVLLISQQMGSAHEDDAVDEKIAILQNIFVFGETIDIHTLITLTDLVLQVGRHFLGYLVDEHDYELKHFQLNVEQ